MNQNLSSYWIFYTVAMPEYFQGSKELYTASLPSANPFRNWKKI